MAGTLPRRMLEKLSQLGTDRGGRCWCGEDKAERRESENLPRLCVRTLAATGTEKTVRMWPWVEVRNEVLEAAGRRGHVLKWVSLPQG